LGKNRNYLRGRSREYLRVNFYKCRGFVATRFAGSHSPSDLAAIDPRLYGINKIPQGARPEIPEIYLEQIKSKKGKRKIIIKHKWTKLALITFQEVHYV